MQAVGIYQLLHHRGGCCLQAWGRNMLVTTEEDVCHEKQKHALI